MPALPPLCKYCKEKNTGTRWELGVGRLRSPAGPGVRKAGPGKPTGFLGLLQCGSHRKVVLTLSECLMWQGGSTWLPPPPRVSWADHRITQSVHSPRGRNRIRVFSEEHYLWLSHLLDFCLAPAPVLPLYGMMLSEISTLQAESVVSS